VLFMPSNNLFLDPDTLMHIAAGKWILQHHLVPQVDPFSFNTAGKIWIDHEWLSQCLMALVDQRGGLFGLRILAAFLFAWTIALEARFLLKRVPAIYAILLLVFCVVSLANHILVRPHLFTWPLIVIWFSVLTDVLEGKRKLPYWLSLLMIPWANLHGSFILGLALTPLFLLQAYYNSPKQERPHLIKSWIPFFLLTALFSFFTPHGIDGLKFGADLLSSEYIAWIVEWAPTSGAQLLPIFFWIVLILVLGARGGLALSVGRLVLIIGLLYEAIQHVRYVSIFGLLAPLLLATPIGEFCSARSHDKPSSLGNSSFKRSGQFIAWKHWLGCIGIIFAVTFLSSRFVVSLTPEISAPYKALNAARENGIKGKVLNFYNFGGFLISQGVPVFIDGRADLYGNKAVNDYFEWIHSSDVDFLSRKFVDEGISWTIFPPNQKIVLYLDTQKDWKRVYEDKVAVVHRKVEGNRD